LTEREGDKIQNAKAPLNPQQGVEAFKASLKEYMGIMQSSRKDFAAALQERDAEVPVARPVPTPPETRPGVDALAPSARPTPAPAPRPTPAPAPAAKPKYKATRID
jgi:hypothetical protein